MPENLAPSTRDEKMNPRSKHRAGIDLSLDDQLSGHTFQFLRATKRAVVIAQTTWKSAERRLGSNGSESTKS
jgi:hypothetical protein